MTIREESERAKQLRALGPTEQHQKFLDLMQEADEMEAQANALRAGVKAAHGGNLFAVAPEWAFADLEKATELETKRLDILEDIDDALHPDWRTIPLD